MKSVTETSKDPYQRLDEYYQAILRSRDTGYQAAIHRFEEVIAHSLKWRIGSFFVDNVIRAVNFITSPVKYSRNRHYRLSWHGEQVSAAPRFHVPFDIFPDTNHLEKPLRPFLPDTGKEGEMTADGRPINEIPLPVIILDHAAEAFFIPGNNILKITPEKFEERLDMVKPLFFLCESSVRGNDGAWQYKMVTPEGQIHGELEALVRNIEERGIPSFFWMTCPREEEPVFRAAARQFDKVLFARPPEKEDIAMFGEGKTGYLPFGVNPAIHHPLIRNPRNERILMLLNHTHPIEKELNSRIRDFIRPVMDRSLDIYNRHFGEWSLNEGSTPEFAGNFRGYAKVPEMAEKFREYSALLNIVTTAYNRVPRRIFEALASGIPVVSQPDPVLEKTFGEVILFAENGIEVSEHLTGLKSEPLHQMQRKVKGLREVMSHHLYEYRLRELLSQAGLAKEEDEEPEVCILVNISKHPGIASLAGMIRSQRYKPAAVALFTEEEVTPEKTAEMASLFQGMRVNLFHIYQSQINLAVRETMKCDLYSFWEPGCFYGTEYLNDYRLALKYSDARAFGKNNYYVHDGDKLNEVNPGMDYRLVPEVPLCTLVVAGEELNGINFLGLLKRGNIFHSFNEEILSIDPLNFAMTESRRVMENDPLIKKLNI